MEFPTSLAGYTLGKIIGKTLQSTVYQATVTTTSHPVVIKTITYTDTIMESAILECQRLIMLEHPNIIQLHTCFADEDKLYLIMPRMGSDLKQYIDQANKKGEPLDQPTILSIFKQVLKGLQHLHDHGFTHRDIKAANIFVDEDGLIKLGDFGTLQESKDCKTFIGTPNWMAPEIVEQLRKYDQSADVWSLGILMYELINGIPPYFKLQPLQIMLNIIQNPVPPIETAETEDGWVISKVDSKIKRLIGSCLNKKPELRPSVNELLNHRSIRSIKDGFRLPVG